MPAKDRMFPCEFGFPPQYNKRMSKKSLTHKQYDFTVGSIPNKMLWFAIPTFIGNVLQASYQLVDSLWVGNLLGQHALAAVSVSSPIIFTILSFMIGMNSSTLAILSQLKGRGDHSGLKHSINAFVVILGMLTLVFGLIGFFASGALLRMLSTPEEIFADAALYLKLNFLGILFLFGYNFIGTVLRALGDSRTPVRFIMLAVILNAVLDPLLIWGAGLGIAGAAYATVIAQGAAFIYGLVFSIKKAGVPFSIPKWPKAIYAKAVLKLGLPSGLQMVAISSGMVVIMWVVNSFGEAYVVAGFGAAQRLEQFILLPSTTLGSVVTSMSGQNIGANLWNRVTKIAKTAVIMILSFSLLIGLAVFLSAHWLIAMFVDDPETIRFGAMYLRGISFFYVFIGVNFVLNGVARSAGAMIQVLILNIISFWVLRFPLAWAFSHWLGEKGLALGIGLSFVLSSIIAALYYFFGGWRRAKIFE